MISQKIETILYIGDTVIGDVNNFAKNRHLEESLKSEQTNPSFDLFSFDINWRKFQQLAARRFDEDPATLLRVGKTRLVFVIDGLVRFAGYLAVKPARSGNGPEQTLSLTFYEHFARLSGDLVVNQNDRNNPLRSFVERPGHLYVQDLINEFKSRASVAGEVLNWNYRTIQPMANKTITYKDFQTVSKALSDAMNNTIGTGKFDIVFTVDKDDYTKVVIDILTSRGYSKNITIMYPSDGVYKLWSSDYEIEESNDYASSVLVSGNGQVGDPSIGENTAPIATADNNNFVQEYCYYRIYDTQSNLETRNAVQNYANKKLADNDFTAEVPKIKLIGRPIAWGDASNDNNGLAIGDSFYLKENTDDGTNNSTIYRIIGLTTDYDSNGVATVEPKLQRAN